MLCKVQKFSGKIHFSAQKQTSQEETSRKWGSPSDLEASPGSLQVACVGKAVLPSTAREWRSREIRACSGTPPYDHPVYKTTSLLRPYSFKPNVKNVDSFYYFEDPVNATTSLLRPDGPTVVVLTGFHCSCSRPNLLAVCLLSPAFITQRAQPKPPCYIFVIANINFVGVIFDPNC